MREAVESEIQAGLIFGHARFRALNETANGVGCEGRRIFKTGQLIGFIDHAQTISGMHESQGRVGNGAKLRQRLDQIVRCFEPIGIKFSRLIFKALPAGKANAHALCQPGFAEDFSELAILAARLAHEAQGLPQHPLETAAGGFGIGQAFIASQQCRSAAGHHDIDRLFKTWIKTRCPGNIGRMFAVTIDDQSVQRVGSHPGNKLYMASGVDFPIKQRFDGGFTEVWQFDGR